MIKKICVYIEDQPPIAAWLVLLTWILIENSIDGDHSRIAKLLLQLAKSMTLVKLGNLQ